METSVRLQEMLSHSKLPIFLVLGAIALILLCLIIMALVKYLKSRERKQKQPEAVLPKTVNVIAVKQNYLNRLKVIEMKYQRNECTVRDAYQEMSAIIRGFVEELTCIKVQSCTLQDIKNMHMPALEELMTEYYSPEFAQKSEGDVIASIRRTWGAIERWN